MSEESNNYERFVRNVIQRLAGVEAYHQKRYCGRISGRSIVVDVAFDYAVAGASLLFIVECKHYSATVSVDDVEEFHSKIDDIGAHKGIIVTTVGYQKGAIQTATGRGIALAVLTEEAEEKGLIYIANSKEYSFDNLPRDEFWRGAVILDAQNCPMGFSFRNMGGFLGVFHSAAFHQKFG